MQRNTRTISTICSIKRNGFINTLLILFQLVLIKFNVRKHVSIKGFQKIYLRNKTSDIPVLRQIFFDAEYDIDFPLNPAVIIDLGANIGLFSLLMNNRFPDAKIIALESEKSNYDHLIKNIKGRKNIDAKHLAIWKENNTLEVTENPNYGEWGSGVKEKTEAANQAQQVKSITLKDLMKMENIDDISILKIDIEGSEFELFESNIEWMHHVKVIIIEVHDFMKPFSSNPFIKALSQLKKFHFQIHGENMIIINMDN